jgi:hypothetical protein
VYDAPAANVFGDNDNMNVLPPDTDVVIYFVSGVKIIVSKYEEFRLELDHAAVVARFEEVATVPVKAIFLSALYFKSTALIPTLGIDTLVTIREVVAFDKSPWKLFTITVKRYVFFSVEIENEPTGNDKIELAFNVGNPQESPYVGDVSMQDQV